MQNEKHHETNRRNKEEAVKRNQLNQKSNDSIAGNSNFASLTAVQVPTRPRMLEVLDGGTTTIRPQCLLSR